MMKNGAKRRNLEATPLITPLARPLNVTLQTTAQHTFQCNIHFEHYILDSMIIVSQLKRYYFV